MQRHAKREDLIGEHPSGDMGQIILLVIFLAVWIIDSFLIKYSTFLANTIPLYIRIPVAVFVLFVGLYLAKKSTDIIFKTIREEPSVVNHGVFSKVRHPMYLAALLFYVGLFLFTLSMISFIIFIIIFLFYNFIAKHEEKMLTDKFGKDYTNYMENVSRWFPKFY